jgi:predicted nuclease of predicted toxin-antitoxin system
MKKVLLDENLPKRLFYRLLDNGFAVESVRSMGWLSLKNGKLIKKTVESGFDIFLTSDKKMQFEHNISKIPLAIVILDVKNLNYQTSIQPLLPQIIDILYGSQSFHFYMVVPSQ